MLAGVISPLTHYAVTSHHFNRHRYHHRYITTSDAKVKTVSYYYSSELSASVWHDILPAAGPAGEGSWNVAWDVRPARLLHRSQTAWLLFGICACLSAAPQLEPELEDQTAVNDDDKNISTKKIENCVTVVSDGSTNYKITGVPADGRCLFRAIAHMVCLRNGEEAPDENRQRELADELRDQVVDELLKRRKEIEWFIEGDFDVYVKRIEKPYVWGGEPELLMASHILKTTISVFMLERNSVRLLNIATYGKEYEQDEKSSIKILFYGYGHYDILEEIL
ncbi:OTU domain-containing protein-like protein [Tanacetum coccineum]|uniref:Ubiquitin thioesterase OTU n=1 Tax=Tanacetum coccineum TaxID=301880 RepID=A0ABQ4XZV6_9ASTR